MIGSPRKSAVLSGLLALAMLGGCEGPASPYEDLYLLAAEALGPEAHGDRQRVVSPVLVALDNPRLPHGVLRDFRNRGYEIFGGSGEEDPEKATYYLTIPAPLPNDRYRLRVHVSLGGRMGSMDRGDTWWIVTGSCAPECRVLEVRPAENRSWY